MLALADTNIEQFLPLFASTGVSVAFLVPTPTGYEKSIMDATAPVREFLRNSGIHDYENQEQGPEYKRNVQTYFVESYGLLESSASLYRPRTKKGDPRIWFSNLRKYCEPRNLLAVISINRRLYVFNLSKEDVASSLMKNGLAHDILTEAAHKENATAYELLSKLKEIHMRGFLQSITSGDPGVGDTLEYALGIRRNNSKAPDYFGIELKATRFMIDGKKKSTTRSTLFTKVPDAGLTYREIVEQYGKWQVPRGKVEPRLQLYETVRCSKANAYDLILSVGATDDELALQYMPENKRKFVSAWKMSSLKAALLTKHPETFWVKAAVEVKNGIEHFRYDRVLHTRHPNASLLAPLLEADKITVDLAAHFEPDGKCRDHGMLFKMFPDDLPLLLGQPQEYIL